MKVYVVALEETTGYCESCYGVNFVVEGVFSTREKADEWVRLRGSWQHDVTEHEIDAQAVEAQPK